jgi:hypothetical protein
VSAPPGGELLDRDGGRPLSRAGRLGRDPSVGRRAGGRWSGSEGLGEIGAGCQRSAHRELSGGKFPRFEERCDPPGPPLRRVVRCWSPLHGSVAIRCLAIFSVTAVSTAPSKETSRWNLHCVKSFSDKSDDVVTDASTGPTDQVSQMRIQHAPVHRKCGREFDPLTA